MTEQRIAVSNQRRPPLVRQSAWLATLGVAASSALIWAFAAQAQTDVQGLRWAGLDILSHAAIAAFVCVWTVPAWGWRPFMAAIVAAIVIDVDHLIAARSIDPQRITALKSRPATHSLASAAAIATAAWLLGGRRIGYAVGLGLLTHIVRDAAEFPGVPLWVPFDWNRHVMLDDRSVALIFVGCLLVNVMVLKSWIRSSQRLVVHG
jgi:membrane-bound metal-dependent hydrolase YbcI (DUF457 family)